MTELAEVQRAFTRICFDEEPRAEDLAVLHGDRERWLLYRRMVRGRLVGMMRSGLPEAAELLGDRFERAASAYLAAGGPRSRFIRDVVHELVEHALPGWEADPELAPHVGDLVRFEEAKWRVASMPAELPSAADFDFEAVPVFNPALVAVSLRHRVDKDARAPAALHSPSTAVVHRKPDGARIYTYVLNDIGGRLFAAWRSGKSCADGTRAVLADLGRQPDAGFIDGMAGVLADLIEQKIILGSRP